MQTHTNTNSILSIVYIHMCVLSWVCMLLWGQRGYLSPLNADSLLPTWVLELPIKRRNDCEFAFEVELEFEFDFRFVNVLVLLVLEVLSVDLTRHNWPNSRDVLEVQPNTRHQSTFDDPQRVRMANYKMTSALEGVVDFKIPCKLAKLMQFNSYRLNIFKWSL